MKPSDNPTLSIGRSRQTLTRRTFLATAGAAAAGTAATIAGIRVPVSQAQPGAPESDGFTRSAWIPNVWHSGIIEPMPTLPTGLGLCINQDMYGSPVTPEQVAQLIGMALETFDPSWWYHWRQWPPNNHAGFVPLIEPLDYPLNVSLLNGFKQAMAAVGASADSRAWFIGNEPEFIVADPQRSVDATVAQVERLNRAVVAPVVIAPGTNIGSEAHMAYAASWCEAASRAGFQYTLAIHFYDHNLTRLTESWSRFCSWHDEHGYEPVVISECGAGGNRTETEWLAVMPFFYGLLADRQRVRALAPSGSAYDVHHPSGLFRGLMTLDGVLTDLGHQYLEQRREVRHEL